MSSFNKDAMPGDAISTSWFLFRVNNVVVVELPVIPNRMTKKVVFVFVLEYLPVYLV